MAKYYFVRVEYRVEDEEPVIYLWGRELISQEKYMFRVLNFSPYFYVLEKEQVPKIPQIRKVISGFKSIFGEPCKKIICNVPESVKDIKSQFEKTFEADIPYVRRFLINSGIRRYFTIPDGKEELDWKEVIGE